MATILIQNLTAATTPLTGAELIPLVQGGITKQTAMTNALAQPYYAKTTAENTAGVTPTYYTYPSHDICGYVLPERYGAVGNGTASDTTNGALDTTAIGRAITIASATKCPILLSRQYIAVPATVTTQESIAITVAWVMLSNLHIVGEKGASITLANSQSTDGTPKNLALFHTNSTLTNVSFKDVLFDLNGANNKISPSRPVTYETTFNMAAISVSGTPAGVAARIDDAWVEGCTFKNCPGVSALVCGQSNTASVTLGQRWTIKNNLFLNNGTDTNDHTSIYAWADNVLCEGNVFWEDLPPHTVGKTGGATCYEVHGSNHRVIGNYFYHYTLGLYIAGNLTNTTLNTIVEGNNFYCSDWGIILFRSNSPSMLEVSGVVIEGNSFYFDNYTYTGQTLTRAAVTFQGQIATQQLACNNVKIHGNYAIAAGTTLYSNFVRWDTVTAVASICSNLSITNNQVIGFTEGVYILTNATNKMGNTEISGNQFISLTPDTLANPPMGIHVNATGGFATLTINGNQFIDERGSPSFAYGLYLTTGTITDFYFGPQVYKGLTTANYFETGSIAVTNWLAPPRDGINTITYSASMTPDASAGADQVITATNGTAFTINAPIRPRVGANMTITIRNAAGGALGAVTWNAIYGMSAWTQPANGFSRSITFRYNGSLWIQKNQTGVDVLN